MFMHVVKFELLKIFGDLRSVTNNAIFLILSSLIFVFAVSNDLSNDKIYGVGIILSLLLLAIIIDLDLIFRNDYISGLLEQIIFTNIDIGIYLLAKFFSYLLVTILIKVTLLPIILYGFGLFDENIKYFLIILLVSLPVICAVLFLAALLSYKLEGRAYLVFLIALPLLIPPIILFITAMHEIYNKANLAGFVNYVEYLVYVELIFLPTIYFLAYKLFFYLLRNN
jgi:heme exporter protein CcmB